MIFSPPKKFSANITKTEFVNKKVIKIGIKLLNNEIINIKAGQFINIKVDSNTFRPYSISKIGENYDYIEILVAAGHEGIGANFIKKLKVGDSVEFLGPAGRFVLPEETSKHMMFIATGTGLAPFFAMFDELLKKSDEINIVLYFGVRDETELFEMDELYRFSKSFKNFKFTICFSQEQDDTIKLYNGIKGRVTDIDNSLLLTNNSTQYFLCGNPNMTIEITKKLINLGIKESYIFHEKFVIAKKSIEI